VYPCDGAAHPLGALRGRGTLVRKTWILAGTAAAALVLAGCGSTSTGGSAASGGSSSSTSSSSPAADTDLASWESPLGTIVVDAKGQTAYMFDKDTAGSASACTGQCASLWFPVTSTSATPSVTGVSGTVGTAATADGKQQVTLDGHRLYTFSGDSGAQQVNGQGFMGLWWTVAPDGTKVTGTASSSSSSSSSSSASPTPDYSY
jgi:predicted lipoprotein with Yx(FWY)xxD motif